MGPAGLEPATADLKGRCSTAELRSHVCTRNRWVLSSSAFLLVDQEGIEPPCPEGRPLYRRVQLPVLLLIR